MPTFKPFARILASADMLANPDTTPEFIVHTHGPVDYAIELATDSVYFSPSFEPETNSATPRWFSTANGNTHKNWLIPPEVRRTQRADPYAFDVWTPSGKMLALYNNMIQNARGDQLFYRVVVDGLNLYPAAIPKIKGRKMPALRHTYVCTSRGVLNRTQPTVDPSGSLPALRVSGNRLTISGTDAPVVLRGVNVSSLQYRTYDSPSAVLGAANASAAPKVPMPGQAAGSWSAAAGIDAKLFDWLQTKGVNIVRLTVNQEWALEDEEYRAALDRIIQWANQRAIYLLLALHCVYIVKRPNVPNTDDPYHPPIPDQRTGLFWSLMARRYKEFPGVMFDLLNEPRTPKPDDKSSKKAPTNDAASNKRPSNDAPYYVAPQDNPIPQGESAFFFYEWQSWARYLHRLIRGGSASQFGVETQSTRATNGLRPDAVVFVAGFGGNDWSASLAEEDGQRKPGWPLTEVPPSYGAHLEGIVYKIHWYGHPGVNGREDWLHLMRATEKIPWQFPIFIGEWGAETIQSITCKPATDSDAGKAYKDDMGERGTPNSDETMVIWANKLVTFLDERAAWLTDDLWKGLCGWTAWSMGDGPHLVLRNNAYLSTGPNQSFQPTDHGSIVFAALHAKLQWATLTPSTGTGAPPPRLNLTFPSGTNVELRVNIVNNANSSDPVCGFDVVFQVAQSASVVPLALATPPKQRPRDSTQSTFITTTSVGRCTLEAVLYHPTAPKRALGKVTVDVVVAAKSSK